MPFGLGGSSGTVIDVEHRRGQTYPWVVVKNGSQVLSRHRKKSAAEDAARRAARSNEPAEMNVYNQDGGFSHGNEYD